MKATTSTQVTHYEAQKKRRTTLLEEWRGYHRTVLRRANLSMVEVPGGDDPYARRTQWLARQWEGAESSRLITRFDDVRGLVTKRGARSLFLVDKSIGYQTAGLSAVMHELAPDLYRDGPLAASRDRSGYLVRRRDLERLDRTAWRRSSRPVARVER